MTTNCTQKEPFVKLDDKGKASILNYSLPQNTQSDRQKWDRIYNYLIKRRIGNKYVGKIKVF